MFSLTLNEYLTHLIEESRSKVGSNQQTVFRFAKIYSNRTVQSIITTNKLFPLSTIWCYHHNRVKGKRRHVNIRFIIHYDTQMDQSALMCLYIPTTFPLSSCSM